MDAMGFQSVMCGLFAIAAASDVAARRIPNAIVVSTAALGLFGNAYLHGIAGVGSTVGAGAATVIVLMFAWRGKLLGGGDVKLAAAAAAALGLKALPLFALSTAVLGGVVALFSWGAAAASDGRVGATASVRVPYGAAIAFGAAFVLVAR